MHEHVRKYVKMHRKPTGGVNKHGKHSIARSGKGKVRTEQLGIRRCLPNGYNRTKSHRGQM